MSEATAKSVKEDISRATAYARRAMSVKALQSAGSALDGYASSRSIIGRAKLELEILLQDMLRELELMPEVKAHLKGSFKLRKGAEAVFAKALAALAVHLEKLEHQKQAVAGQKTRERLDRTFQTAQDALREKNLPAVRRILNTVCEQNPTEPGIHTRAAMLLAEAGLHPDVIGFAEKAIEQNPKDARAFSLGVEACKQIGELPKAEVFLRDALKNFGAHPKTYISLARVLYQMHKWDEAYDAARAAYDRDNSLAEAKELVELTEKRVMG